MKKKNIANREDQSLHLLLNNPKEGKTEKHLKKKINL